MISSASAAPVIVASRLRPRVLYWSIRYNAAGRSALTALAGRPEYQLMTVRRYPILVQLRELIAQEHGQSGGGAIRGEHGFD